MDDKNLEIDSNERFACNRLLLLLLFIYDLLQARYVQLDGLAQLSRLNGIILKENYRRLLQHDSLLEVLANYLLASCNLPHVLG